MEVVFSIRSSPHRNEVAIVLISDTVATRAAAVALSLAISACRQTDNVSVYVLDNMGRFKKDGSAHVRPQVINRACLTQMHEAITEFEWAFHPLVCVQGSQAFLARILRLRVVVVTPPPSVLTSGETVEVL